jgi:hypothetical protein
MPERKAATGEPERQRYAFSSAARCPGCRGTETAVVDTKGFTRWWRCKTPGCHYSLTGGRRTWKEIGEAI